MVGELQRRRQRRRRTTNDLLYIPTATDPITYTNGTYADLLAFVNAEECLASQHRQDPRAQRLPRAVDEHARHEVQRRPAGQARRRWSSRWDILNVINLIDAEERLPAQRSTTC